jgi:O2-independent ubiquinone biosynthesis protein UbiV
MKISVGPISYYWPKDRVYEFYQKIADQDVDIVYLGETVCGKRNQMAMADWLDIAERLSKSGKECVLSTLCLLEAQSDLSRTKKICKQREFRVEANDYAAIHCLKENKHDFVSGFSLNLYSIDAINSVACDSFKRWAAPIELEQNALSLLINEIKAQQPALQIELFAYGPLPLAYSARCFTARAANIEKDKCKLRCINHPSGIVVNTQENHPIFTLNGIQTQSGKLQNLIYDVENIVKMGVDVIRLDPCGEGFIEVIEKFRRVINNPSSLGEVVKSLDAGQYCNGYWHNKDGHQLISAHPETPVSVVPGSIGDDGGGVFMDGH